ncbi:hypothetical protein EV385_6672 [Krasilnikovia cinnamomea]|uniref:Uncharacterized protein n=1 Tax=Krasilnikovia cinnamomea TaxID=349313 RepID=A0A4Q7Z7X3_9ACTN|nr:hypothetical protein [Krasilnikovia cinnamomea]RZU46597.1 hypothetical protein EV385_6672 [Krasilnikovia cinnamomea]
MTSSSTDPAPADLAVLAAHLAQIAAGLDGYIAAAAERIAQPRIDAAAAGAAARLAAVTAQHEAERNRAAHLETELRHQLDTALRQVARLRWAARYLPHEVRVLVLPTPNRRDGWSGDRPDPATAVRIDTAAAAAGVPAYPGHPTTPPTRSFAPANRAQARTPGRPHSEGHDLVPSARAGSNQDATGPRPGRQVPGVTITAGRSLRPVPHGEGVARR